MRKNLTNDGQIHNLFFYNDQGIREKIMSVDNMTLVECVDDVQSSQFKNTDHKDGPLRHVIIKVTLPSVDKIEIRCTEADLKIAKAALLPAGITEDSLKGSQKQLLAVIDRALGVLNLSPPARIAMPPILPDSPGMRYHG